MKHTWICLAALAFACCGTKDSEAKSGTSGVDSSAGGATRTAPEGAESHEMGRGKDVEPTLTQAMEYYDGATKRKLWVSEDLVAEFEPTDAGREAMMRADPSAREVEQPQKGVRLWRVGASGGAEAFARNESAGTMRLSPVLHEGPSPAMPMRALPGGVVITFAKDWDRARIDEWLATRGLKVESEVGPAANMFLVSTAPGLESIRVANQLHESGELVDVAPNFWMQAATR